MQMEQSEQIYLQLKKINESMLMIMTTANIINKERKKSITIHNNNNMQITTNKNSSVWQTQDHKTQPLTLTSNRWYNPRFKTYYWNGLQVTTV